MSKLLQEMLEETEMQCVVLNYIGKKLEVSYFYKEKNYESFCNGINCLGGMGLYNSNESLDFHNLDNITFIIQENKINQKKIKYDIVEEYKIQYKEKNDKSKKTLSVKIKGNKFNPNDYYLVTPNEAIFFDELKKAKEYLDIKYNNLKHEAIFNG